MITQQGRDIAFGSNLWVSSIFGIMLFMTGLSLLVSIGINQYIQTWNTSVQATFTLELPSQTEQRMPDIMQAFKDYPEIESIAVLDKAYVEKLMLEIGVASSKTPILIDFIVSKEQLSSFNSDKVLADIRKIVPDSSIVKPVVTSPEALAMARMIELIAFGFGFTMMIAMCAMIAFVTYSEVQTHERTIGLFNLLGAPNYYIARIFQKYASIILVKGILISLALNICLYYVTYVLYLDEDAYLIQELPWVSWVYSVFGIPVLMIAIIQFIVPMTVLSCLKKKYKNSLQR